VENTVLILLAPQPDREINEEEPLGGVFPRRATELFIVFEVAFVVLFSLIRRLPETKEESKVDHQKGQPHEEKNDKRKPDDFIVKHNRPHTIEYQVNHVEELQTGHDDVKISWEALVDDE